MISLRSLPAFAIASAGRSRLIVATAERIAACLPAVAKREPHGLLCQLAHPALLDSRDNAHHQCRSAQRQNIFLDEAR